MRTVTAGLVSTFAAAALGVGAIQGVALAQGAPSSPSAGDSGAATGMAAADFLDTFRAGPHSNSSTSGASY
jgi:hypothetical protein